MDGKRFDRFTRVVAHVWTRRGVLGAATTGIGAFLNPGSALACKKVGKKCDKNNDCCDGAKCKGGKNGKCRCKSGLSECPGVRSCKNLKSDLAHCGACGAACPDFAGVPGLVFCVAGACRTCPAGADHCLAPPATCEGRDDCFCMKRVEDGVSACCNRPRCDEPCDADADCFSSAFFCVSGGDSCCPGRAGQGRCAELCAA